MLRNALTRGLMIASALLAAAPARALVTCSGPNTINVPGAFATISAAVASIPLNVVAPWCVNITNSLPYNEQVKVLNFTNNGSSITIQAMPGFYPTVVPPPASTAAFVIASASINIQGIGISVNTSIPYGVLVSSPFVTLSSVNVDGGTGAGVYVAGLSISSWTTVANSSVATIGAHGILLAGNGSRIAFSTAVVGSVNAFALYLNASTGNAVTDSWFSNTVATAAYLASGASYNTLSQSTFTGGNGGDGLDISNSSFNTITLSVMRGGGGTGGFPGGPGGYGLSIGGGASNAVSLSAVTGGTGGKGANPNGNGGGGGYGLYINGSSANTVDQSVIWGGGGGQSGDSNGNGGDGAHGAVLLSGADSNAISRSTATGGVGGGAVNVPGGSGHGLYINASSSNTVNLSVLTGGFGNKGRAGGDGLYITASSSVSIFRGMLTGGNGQNAGPSLANGGHGGQGVSVIGSSSNTINQSAIAGGNGGTGADNPGSGSGGTGGNGVWLGANANFNSVNQSTVTGGSGGPAGTSGGPAGAHGAGLYASSADSNAVTQSYVWGGSRGVDLEPGSDYNTISFSTMVGGAGMGLYAMAASSNSITDSYFWGGSDGARLDNTARYNVISLSTMIGNAGAGFHLLGPSWTTITRSYMSGGNYGAWFAGGSDYNVINLSTMVSSSLGNPSLYVSNSSSNTIQNSYVSGSTAAVISGSTGTLITSSVLVAADAVGSALALLGGDVGLTLASSTLRGGPSGRGLLLDRGNTGVVSIGSVTVTGSARGIEISTQTAGFTLAIDSVTFRSLTAGATAIHYLGGTFSSTFSLVNFEDASVDANVSAAALDTASRITMFAHYGPRTGPTFENDPNALVVWEAGPYPGCAVTKNVGAGQAYGSIQAAVNALPASLTGHSCVVIRDGATYNEQVSVRNFTNNGSSITIMADPASGLQPAIVPALGGFALFEIANASVNVAGIRVSPTVAVQYGIDVSSPNVTISSVSVLDTMVMISAAGISASSWTTVSYSSVSVGPSHGIQLTGTGSAISYSSVTVNAGNGYALYLNASPGNAVTGSVFSNFRSTAVYLSPGSDLNTIRRSTMTGGSNPANFTGGSGLVLIGASTNTIIDGVMLGGRGGDPGQSPGGHGLYISGGSSNTVTRGIMSGGGGGMGGNGTNLGGGAGGTNGGGNSWGGNGLFLHATTSNTITQSLLAGGGGGNGAGLVDSRGHGLSVYGSSYNAVSLSVLAGGGGGGGAPGATGGAGGSLNSGGSGGNGSAGCCDGAAGSHGLYISAGGGWNLFAADYMFGGGGGGAGSTNQAGAGGNGLYIGTSTGNVITGSFLSAGGGGGGSSGGSGGSLSGGGSGGGGGARPGANGGAGASLSSARANTIDLSTMTGGSFGIGTVDGLSGAGLYLYQSSGNTVSRSYMTSPAAAAAWLDSNSDNNTISFSTVAAKASGSYALQVGMSKSNTLQSDVIVNLPGNGVSFSALSDSNSIRQSTVVAGQIDGYGMYAFNSDALIVMGSYLEAASGTALSFDTGADGANVGFSTIVSNSSTRPAASIRTASSDTLTNSFIYNPSGTGVLMGAGAFFNGIVFSTIVVNSAVSQRYAFHSNSGSTNTVQLSYLQAPNAVYINGSTGTVIDSSVLVATGSAGIALNFSTGNMHLTLTMSTLRGGAAGRGLYLDSGNTGRVVIGSVTVTGAARGLEISTQSAGFALAIDSVTFRDLSAGATAIHFLGGTFYSTFTLANFEDATMGANVSAAALDLASRVTMFSHYGVRTSTKYENDPNGVVHWEAGPYPGCVVTRNIGLGQPYATIQAGVNALPQSLAGHSCVVIRDGAVYGEEVTIQGFANNGSSITIMGDPASSTVTPRVVPPMIANAGFNIRNSSVNLSGIEVRSGGGGGGLNYGVYVSSPYVAIASVTVSEGAFGFSVAGISLSSWTTVSYTSVTVNNAYGLFLPGSRNSSVSYSSAVCSSAGPKSAIYAVEAASNSFTAVTAYSMPAPGSATGARFDSSHYNTVSRSSFTSYAGGAGFHLYGSSFNTISGSYFTAPGAYGLRLDAANYNSVSQSTMGANVLGMAALELDNASSNTITGVFTSNSSGYGGVINGGLNNSVSLSTFNAANQYGLYLFNTSSNTVASSYMSNTGGTALYLSAASSNTISSAMAVGQAAAYGVWLDNSRYNRLLGVDALTGGRLDANSDYNFISGSTFTRAADNTVYALSMPQASSNTITRSRITHTNGVALSIVSAGFSNYDTVSQSTITTNTGSAAMNVSGWGHQFTDVYVSNGNGYAVQLQNTRFVTVAQSTIGNNSAGSAALYLNNSSTASITGSVVANAGGDGVFIEATSDWNGISRSVVRGAASGVRVASVTGLSVAFSTAIGGSWIGTAGIHSSGTPNVGVTGSYVEGSTGVYLGNSSSAAVNSNVLAGTGSMGSGLWMTGGGTDLSMSSNTVLGGGLAGVALSQAGGNIVLSTNTIISRGATYGIAAINLNLYTLRISSNTILPALSAAATTYGVYLGGLPNGATVQNNGIYFRTSGGAFPGVGAGAYGLYAAASPGIRIDHNRISNPSKITSGNYIGAALDGLSNAIFKFNDLYSTGGSLTTFNLLKLVSSPNAVVRGNILSSSMTATTNRLIVVDAPSQAGFSSDYNTFFSSNSSYTGVWGGSPVSMLTNWVSVTGRDASSLSGNPLWVDPAGEDFHPLSRGGRWDGAAFVDDNVSGPGLDRADPADSVGDEQPPNGARANQGSYGHTAEGSRSVLPCPTTLYVRQAGDGDALTIQGGVNLLPNPLTSHSCIVIGDAGVYNEQVTVQGFTNNGSSITIMADPLLTSRPTVRSGFVIRNASVNVVGLDISPSAGPLNYGIDASSPIVTITSVSVVDPTGHIILAGVSLSSYSVLTYSNLLLQTGRGLRLTGKFTAVTGSTMTTNGASTALWFDGADSSTVTGSFISSLSGTGAYLLAGADYNTISLSTITSGGAGTAALYASGSSFNGVSGSYISGLSGHGVSIDGGSRFNTISLSTMVSGSGLGYGLNLDAASNVVTGSYIRNGNGGAALLNAAADYNTVTMSTLSSVFNGGAAVVLSGAEFNDISSCTITNTSGHGLQLGAGSDYNRIVRVAASNGSNFEYSLYVKSSSNTIYASQISNPFGISLMVETGSYNRVAESTVTSSGSRALVLFGAQRNTVTRSFISDSSGEAVRVHGGSSFNTISFSTMTGIDPSYSALIITGSSSNTIWNSYIQGSTAVIVDAATGTVINASVIVATNTTGDALVLQGGSVNLSLSSNTLINGSDGAGVRLSTGNMGALVLSTNTFTGGRADLFAYGQAPGTTLWVASNTFVSSIGGTFKAYGVYLESLLTGATIQNNGFYYRAPGTTSAHTSALFAITCDGLVISRNRMSNPGMVGGNALGVGLTGTTNTLFEFNDVHSTGAAIASAYHMRLTNSPGTQLYGNVFSSSWSVTNTTAAIFVDAASQAGFKSDYNDFFSSNSLNTIEWGNGFFVQFPWNAVTGTDGNSLAKHPRWRDASPGAEDFHQLSQAGRWNGTAFVNDGWTSGLLDAGDPLASVGAEAAPNGSRINLGSYGGTAEASKSPERAGAPSIAGVFTSSVSVSYGLTSTASNGYVTAASTSPNFSGTILASATVNNALTALAPQGLSANTTYYFIAGAVWGDFNSFNTTLLSTATLALPPAAAVPAFSSVELSSLTVSWLPNGNPVDVATYSVVLTTGASYPNSFAGNVSFSTLPAGALPTATRTAGLSANTTYFAFVAAMNWSGAPSAYVPAGSTATLAAKPLTAASTFSSVGFSSFSVTWNANGNALAVTTYTVTVSTAADFNAFASSVSFSTIPAIGPGATFTGLSANTEYFFRVRAVNRNGVPTAYAVLGSTETRPVTLQAPAIVAVTAVYASSITATWGLTPLATGYTLVASLINDPTAVAASSSPVGLSATTATVYAPALSPNTTYFLFVRATGPGAQTAFSAFPATATLAAAPATAVSTFSSVFTTSATVSWLSGGNPVNVTSYTVVLSTGSTYPNAFAGNRTISTAPAGAFPAASFTGLLDNTAYFLFVGAVNHNGVPGAFAALGSTVTQITAPSTVYFDEVSSNTIVVSAYAALPGFSNLGAGQSGTRVARNGVYSAFHGEGWAGSVALPSPTHDAGAAGFNGKVYLFGGFNGSTALNSTRVFDPATGIWTTLANLTPRGGLAGAQAGGKLYALGGTFDGFTSLNTVEEYDPVLNVWTGKAPLGVRSDHLSAAGAGGSVFVFAGVTDGADNLKTAQFDPAANAWTGRADYPSALHQPGASVAAGPTGGLVIAAGGSGPSAAAYAFDTGALSWSAKASMPLPSEDAVAASLGGKVYVLGGSPGPKAVYEFDPAANAWTVRADMATGRSGAAAAAAGGRIYVLGGTTDGGATSLTTAEEYDPGVATKFSGLTPNTQAGFKAQARNQAGTRSGETAVVSTWTLAALPAAAPVPFSVVEKDSVTFSWSLNGNPGSTEFRARASTSAAFAAGATVVASDWGAMVSTAALSLTPNTTYFFESAARNGIGGVPGLQTAWVPLGSTATLAAVPAPAPTAFALAGTNSLTVSWLSNGNPPSITTYTVVLSTDAVYPNAHSGNVVLASTFPAGALPTASLAGLVANTTYFAFASALNHNGVRSAYAALGSTATLTVPPAAASPAFSAVGQSSATFSWLPNGNPVTVTSYSVVLSTGGAFNSFAGNVSFSTNPAGPLPTASVAAGLVPNTTYFAYAAAINVNGAPSAYSSLGSTATLAAEPATAIATFSAVNISSLTVSWSAAGNPLAFTTYTVQLSTASDFNAFASSFTFSTAPASGPSATFTGLQDFTQYFFRVRAVNHAGTATGFVGLGSTTTLIAPLDPPALAGFASIDVTSITATWGLVPGATGYTFVASLSPANPPTAPAASSTTASIAATTAAAYSPALSPNTTYFLFVRANGPLRSSPYAAYGATSTLSSPPATAVSTFTGVGITSFTVSWSANGNALAITTYTVQLSTASDFNAFATSVTYTTVPVFGTSAMLTGLTGNTSYYLRVRSINHNGVPSAYVSLGSTLTVVSPLFPTILNSQAGDAVWRSAGATLYNVGFLDTSGAHLDKFQVKASTTAGGAGTDLVPYTDVIVGLLPADAYSTPWALPASVFNSLLEGVTNYITIRAFNGPPLNNFTVLQDAFYVQKDTTAPVFVNTQSGDSTPRSAAGTTYTVAVGDPSSGLAAFQYSASLTAGSGNASLIGWTDIAAVANTTSYATPWTVNFAALVSGVTNYISVRAWDVAGTTRTLTDAFYVHKDTTGPSVSIAAPQTGAFLSSLGTLSGTASSIYGVKGTEVSILDVGSGFYWNPPSSAFNSAAPVMIAASGGASWSLSPGIPWTDGATYRAVARSSTTAGLYSTVYATSTFVMDLSTPTVGVLAPAPDSTVSVLPVISGTAADPAPNPSGVLSVEARLRRNSDGYWWNWFSQAWSATAVSSITAGTTAWSLSPTPQLKSSLAHGSSYYIAVRASDNALPSNQGSFFLSGSTFTWQDAAPPSAVANLAASRGAVPGSINLAWTAPGDDAAAGMILLGEYRIFYSTDVAAIASTAAAQVVVSTANISPGDLQFYTLSGLSPGVTYYVKLALADSDANWSAFSNQASTSAAPSPLNAITGHVVDVATQGITAVQVDCWNASDALVGTAFTLADGSGSFTVDGLPAGSYRLRVTWTVNGFSSSLWQDGIAMGSTDVDFVLEINYALATLTGTLGTFSASSFGTGGLGTASASESFIELYQKGRQVARASVQPSGRWSIPGLLPGAYSVRAFTGLGYTPFQDVQLVEGEIRVLGFVFDPLPEASVFAFPNPARTSTTIRFETALLPLQAGIYIFDLAGNLVKEIPDSQISRAAAPTYRAAWDLNNSAGRPVAPGVYHVVVKVKGGSEDQAAKVIKKLAVVR